MLRLQRQIPLATQTFLLDNLRVMLHAGISLSRALEGLTENVEQRRIAATLAALRSSVERGESFAESVAAHPDVFPSVIVELLRAGEATGRLESALAEAARYLQRERRLRSRIQSALLYPLIVVGTMIIIGIGVVVVVLPRLLDLFRGADVTLPLATRFLLALSDAVAAYGVIIAAIVAAATAAFVVWARTDAGRFRLHRTVLRLGKIGRLAREVNITRLARTLGGLLRTDMPIVRALDLTAMTVGNLCYRRAIKDAAARLARGDTLRDALSNYRDLFPATTLQMVGVGEQSGALDRLLSDLADFYEADLDEALQNLTTIIEPVLILIIGVAVAFLAMAVLQPMYSLAQTI